MKRSNFSHGTLEQFEQLVRDRISKLSGDSPVDSCYSIMSANDGNKFDVKQTWDAVEASLKEKDIKCYITPEPEAVVVYCGTTQYTVPYEDLYLDAEHIDDDVDYIVGYIDDDMNSDNSYE